MITVIIPTFNAAPYIKDTILSVINQTFTQWSMIIVDDHSTDNTWEIINQFCHADSRIKAIQLKKNFGRPAGPRNIGLSHAKTPWVAFLDADDIWHPQKLAIQLDVAKKNQYDLVCSQMTDFTSEPPAPTPIQQGNISCRNITFFDQLTKNRIPTSSVIIKKNVAIQLNGFEESPIYRAIEDYDLWLKISIDNYKVGKCSATLVYYRILTNSISRNKKTHVKKVFWLIYHTLATRRPYLLPIYPYFLLTYILLSIYYRLIMKTL